MDDEQEELLKEEDLKKKRDAVSKEHHVGKLQANGKTYDLYQIGACHGDKKTPLMGLYVKQKIEGLKVPQIANFIVPIVDAGPDDDCYKLNIGMPYFIVNMDGYYEFHFVKRTLKQRKIKELLDKDLLFILP